MVAMGIHMHGDTVGTTAIPIIGNIRSRAIDKPSANRHLHELIDAECDVLLQYAFGSEPDRCANTAAERFLRSMLRPVVSISP